MRRQAGPRLETEFLAYDTTSIASYSKLLNQVWYGNNKDHDPLAQINLALMFGEMSRLPFYYRKLPGNIPDVKTIQNLLADIDFLKLDKDKARSARSRKNIIMVCKGADNMNNLFKSGTFITGCNYWASHAGTAMWQDWRPDVVESDFTRLASAGMKVLRVFPLWPDFQPIRQLRGGSGRPVEYRIGEEPLSDDEEGLAGVSKQAMNRFAEFAALAEKHGIKLIVGLITGWMSGRFFVPPALERLNVLTDPCALMWEMRFISYFVRRFKDARSIIAWDLGNECNCLADVNSSDQAWNWSAAVTNAIRSADATRPVVSGMHSLLPDAVWSMQDQAEITDILTTHPYSYFTPHCDQDPLNTMRTELHPAAATLFYRGIGGKPCFVEELGTLGPMFGSDEAGADFIRNNLFTLWAHDCLGLLWWCANEQSELTHAPYDWNSVERELGLFYLDGTPKPVLGEFSRFANFVETFPHGTLPERLVDGICILTKGQDTWGAAFTSFVLAKQAGLDIEFRYASQPLGEAGLYLLPGLQGDSSISGRRLRELLEKVRNGAVLYMSVDTGLLSPFSEYAGIRVLTREKKNNADRVTFGSAFDDIALDLKGAYKLILETISAEVLAEDGAGNPVFTSNSYGLGKVVFLNYPVELYLLDKPGALHGKDMEPYWTIYKYLKDCLPMPVSKVVGKDSPFIGLTEHPMDEENRIVIAINYEPHPMTAMLTLADGWIVKDCLYGGTMLEMFIGKNKTGDHARGSIPERLVGAAVHDQPVGQEEPIIGLSGEISLSFGKNDAVVFSIEKL